MPKPSSALEAHRDDIRRIVAANRAGNVRVFGSALKGEDTETSDLDILVDALPGATLFDLGAIQVELEELLGVPVDVLTPEDLSPKFRHEVLAEARAV
ncbi:nucleotidyltransferase family protein [Caballeronia sp. LZ025]|jgi:predicted nucleotidyltransferase|uniref:nucleotidyltransferase family protein n=1 Tax=Caballeronia TaxID=1827195 RepID=UPI001FD0B856|nr:MULTISPECIES: nucleotidyltransferase family protein [Caballeronia]MDR5731127.1 nucleotidyltransferase family protein [Caballeronia sp. LZ025]